MSAFVTPGLIFRLSGCRAPSIVANTLPSLAEALRAVCLGCVMNPSYRRPPMKAAVVRKRKALALMSAARCKLACDGAVLSDDLIQPTQETAMTQTAEGSPSRSSMGQPKRAAAAQS